VRVPQSKPQTAYVALLRGINVGRAKRVAMADLRDLFTELGYTGVSTLLNSGNVVFSGPRLTAVTQKRMEDAFTGKFGFTSRMTVLSAAELAQIVAEEPVGNVASDHSRYLIAVLNQPAHRAKLLPLTKEKWEPEVLGVGTRAAYLWCPGGFMESRLQSAVSRVLSDNVTTRNWATVLKLNRLVLTLP
jgi:uncharacterized protein (DUF1697 family)